MLTPASCEQIADWLDANVEALPCDETAVAGAAGRVLGAAVAAPADHPDTAVAAVDGFALSADATVGAGDYNPLPFRVAGSGDPALRPGGARALVSGEALPRGADAVMPLEEAEPRGGMLDIYAPLAPGENVIPPGREARAGDHVLGPGRVLRAADVALLIELGVETLNVVRRPRVGIVVVRDGTRNAGGAMIDSLVLQDGGVGENVERPPGEPLSRTLARAPGDLLIAVGGSGPGPNDPSAGALEQAGEVVFRGAAINPGETATVGRIDGKPVMLLPGPPIAALFAYDSIAGRAVRRLAGRSTELPYGTRRLPLARKIASGLGRLECCRVRVIDDCVEPLAVADNRTLSTAVRADGFVLVPEQSEGYAEGAEVTVYLYDQRCRQPDPGAAWLTRKP